MNTPQTLLKRMTKLGLLLMMGVSMSACSGDQKWKEEVQLSDGRLIVVDRELLTEGGGDELAFNHSGVKPKEYLIRVEHPNGSGKIIEWHSTKKDKQTWPELPLVLDVENGMPVIFSSVTNPSHCHMYFKYIWQSEMWIEEPLPPQFEKRITNLLIRSNKENLPLINLETKRKMNSDVRAQDYKQVGPKHLDCSHR